MIGNNVLKFVRRLINQFDTKPNPLSIEIYYKNKILYYNVVINDNSFEFLNVELQSYVSVLLVVG